MTDSPDQGASRPPWVDFVKLARPQQWAKSVFVLIGPAYHLSERGAVGASLSDMAWPALVAAAVFSLASSGCYVVNDILDADADRTHPRKRHRPVASGAISPKRAWVYAMVLIAMAAGLLLLLEPTVRWWVGLTTLAYVGNVWAYSLALKRVVITDVMCLSLGFVLRVLGGCLAVGIVPTTWLLNSTFFLAMFLAFGKRLGERRTMGRGAASARAVQSTYTDDFLRMAVVVTAVATLLTYAAYVQSRAELFEPELFNLLWVTVLPATYGLLRCIVLLEQGQYDDPTELAFRDRAMQLAVAMFGVMTVACVIWSGQALGAGT